MVKTETANKEISKNGSEETSRLLKVREYVPPVDIYRDNEVIYLESDIPGSDENSVEISFEKNALTIVGKNLNQNLENFNLVYSERAAGNYRRSFQFHENIDSERIQAVVKNGVLKITLPVKQPEIKKIQVKAN